MGYIYANGIHQGDLYALLNSMAYNFNTMCDDLTVDTNGTFNTDAYDVSLSMDNKRVVSGAGLGQDSVYLFLKDLTSKYNTLMTALDSTDLSTNNYAATVALTNYFDNSAQSRNITPQGMFQGDLVYALNHVITKYNALLVKLDADALCAGYVTNYGITDTVNETGA